MKWLEGGHFPGAYRAPDGQWRFPLPDVLLVREAMQAARHRNAAGALELPDLGDEEPKGFPIF